MAKKTATRAKRVVRRDWSLQDEKELRKHSKNRTPVIKISKALKRSPTRHLGIPIGHRRRPKKRSQRT
jgi:hypothetical protein